MSGVQRWSPENTFLGYNMKPVGDGAFVLYEHYERDTDRLKDELAEKIRDEVNLKLIVDAAKNNQEELRESRDSFQRVGIQTMEKLAGAELKISELVAAFTPLIKNWDDLATGESANVDRARKALNQKSDGN